MGKRVVFVGGGHAHLTSLKNLPRFGQRGHRATLISSSPYHYYSGMGPGMLSGIYHPRQARFHVKKLAEDRGATFIQGKVIGVDPLQRLLSLDSGEKIGYDLVSFNTGSEVPLEALARVPAGNLFPVKPVLNLLLARQAIRQAIRGNGVLHFVVVGGGPAGVEVAGNLLRLLHESRGKGEIALIAGKGLLGDAPAKVQRLARESLTRRGVEVIEGSHVKAVEKGRVTLDDGRRFDTDFAFIAVGIQLRTLFRDSGIPVGPDGGLLVNSSLQSVAHPDIFGGGDCISLEGNPLAKVGVYAVRENPVLYHNVLAALEKGKMEAFTPQKEFLLILNMGNGRGIFWKKNWIWEGRLAFLLKDYIDRKFMRTFQISGELDEQSGNIE